MSNILPFLQHQLQQVTLNIEHIQKDIVLMQTNFEQKLAQQKRELNSYNDHLIANYEQSNKEIKYQIGVIQDKVSSLIENKMDQVESFKMMESNKQELLEDIQLFKSELQYQKNYYDDLMKNKYTHYETLVQEQNKQFKDQIKQVQQLSSQQLQEQQVLFKSLLNANKKSFCSEIERLQTQATMHKNEFNQQLNLKVDKAQLQTVQEKITIDFEAKADLIEVQTAVNSQQVEFGTRLQEIRDEIKGILEITTNEIFHQINKKATLSEIQNQLSQKIDRQTLEDLTHDKLPIKEFKQHLTLIEGLALDIGKKSDISHYQELKEFLTMNLNELQTNLDKKLSKRDFKEQLDKKANHIDINKAFQDVQYQLQLRNEELLNFKRDQQMQNDTIMLENASARWGFNGNFICAGSLVPWNQQIINTQPETFLWEKDKPNILVISPGLYEIKLGFFSKKKPKIDIMVNGEIIIGAINNSSYVVHHSSGRLKELKQSITGLTLIDFIQLPARARINIAYQGDLGEGFLSLRKL